MLGALTQQLTLLDSTRAQLDTLRELPAPIMGARQMASSLLERDGFAIRAIQAEVLDYTQSTLLNLQSAKENIAAHPGVAPMPAVKDIINTTSQRASLLAADVVDKVATISTSRSQFVDISTQLSTLDQTLRNQLSTLQSQAQEAQGKVDYYAKRKAFLTGLGMGLGFPGLNEIAETLESWVTKVNVITTQVDMTRTNITNLQQLIYSIEYIYNLIDKVIGQVMSIKNSADFLSAELVDILRNLSDATDDLGLLFLTTAIDEVQTLQTDAS